MSSSKLDASDKQKIHLQRIYIHFDHLPTDAEKNELASLGIYLSQKQWIPYSTTLGGFYFTEVDVDKFDKLIQLDFIKRISSAERPIIPQLDYSIPAIRADLIQNMAYNGVTLDGKDVRVAIIDTGMDTTHMDLENKIVDSRDCVGDGLIVDEYVGHGTHIAGIISGSGIRNSSYVGMAPNVSLIILDVIDNTGSGNLAQAISEAVDDFNASIISISLGTYTGYASHRDGTDEISLAVDYAVDKGAIVVVSAGNDADYNAHIEDNLSPGENRTYSITNGAGLYRDGYIYLVWNNSENNMDFEIFNSTGTVIGPGLGGYYNNTNLDSKGFLDDHATVSFTFGVSYNINIFNRGTSTQNFDLYQDNSGTYRYINLGSSASSNKTITAPAVANKAIAVGSYVTKDTYYDFRGNVTHSGTQGDFSTFSSLGPTLDGRIKPDIIAPGEVIVSTSSNDTIYSEDMIIDNGTQPNIYVGTLNGLDYFKNIEDGYIAMSGTSMAAPHISGLAALLRQVNNNLTYAQIKFILNYTGIQMYHNEANRYFPRVDAYNASLMALYSDFFEVSNDGDVNLSVTEINSSASGITNVYPRSFTVEPGHNKTVMVTVDLGDEEEIGSYSTNVIVYSNDPDESEKPVQIIYKRIHEGCGVGVCPPGSGDWVVDEYTAVWLDDVEVDGDVQVESDATLFLGEQETNVTGLVEMSDGVLKLDGSEVVFT